VGLRIVQTSQQASTSPSHTTGIKEASTQSFGSSSAAWRLPGELLKSGIHQKQQSLPSTTSGSNKTHI